MTQLEDNIGVRYQQQQQQQQQQQRQQRQRQRHNRSRLNLKKWGTKFQITIRKKTMTNKLSIRVEKIAEIRIVVFSFDWFVWHKIFERSNRNAKKELLWILSFFLEREVKFFCLWDEFKTWFSLKKKNIFPRTRM